jgi:plastocyanin
MIKFGGFVSAILLSLCLLLAAPSNASEITDSFMEARQTNNIQKMKSIIKENKEKIPEEVNVLMVEALNPETPKEEREGRLFLAELIARTYQEVTRDASLLIGVKRKVFNTKLTPAVISSATEGLHIVDIPKPDENTKNIFKPDNIIIKKGETVKWVNDDSVEHKFSTVTAISESSFDAKTVEPGNSFEYKFEKPGEYFYICFIHQSMIGKITAEE